MLRFFRRSTPETEARRGAADARAFLARNPTQAEIDQYRSAACADEAFDRSERGLAYARAAKAVIDTKPCPDCGAVGVDDNGCDHERCPMAASWRPVVVPRKPT